MFANMVDLFRKIYPHTIFSHVFDRSNAILAMIVFLYFWRVCAFGAVFGNYSQLVTFPGLQSNHTGATSVDKSASFNVNPHLSDNIVGFIPSEHLVSGAQRSGQVALWDPYVGRGMPLVAKAQPSVFYPVSVILRFLFDPSKSFTYAQIFDLVLFGSATRYLLRALRLPERDALIGGIVAALSGRAITWVSWGPSLGCSAWFVLSVSGLVRSRNSPDFTSFSLIAGGWAMVIFRGMPLIWLFASLLWLFIGISTIIILGPPKKNLNTSMMFYLVAPITGLAVAAVQLIPTVELYVFSTQPTDPFKQLKWSSGVSGVSEIPVWFIGKFLGSVRSFDEWHGWFSPTERYGTIGISGANLATLGFVGTPKRLRNVLAGLLLVLLSLSIESPITRFISDNPFFSRFSFTRANIFATVILCIFAGYGSRVVAFGRAERDLGRRLFLSLLNIYVIAVAGLHLRLIERALAVVCQECRAEKLGVSDWVGTGHTWFGWFDQTERYPEYWLLLLFCACFWLLSHNARQFRIPHLTIGVMIFLEAYLGYSDFNVQSVVRSGSESASVRLLQSLSTDGGRFTTIVPMAHADAWHHVVIHPNLSQKYGLFDSRVYESFPVTGYVRALKYSDGDSPFFPVISLISVPRLNNLQSDNSFGITTIVRWIGSEKTRAEDVINAENNWTNKSLNVIGYWIRDLPGVVSAFSGTLRSGDEILLRTETMYGRPIVIIEWNMHSLSATASLDNVNDMASGNGVIGEDLELHITHCETTECYSVYPVDPSQRIALLRFRASALDESRNIDVVSVKRIRVIPGELAKTFGFYASSPVDDVDIYRAATSHGRVRLEQVDGRSASGTKCAADNAYARFVSQDFRRIVYEYKSCSSAKLVTSDEWFPGWTYHVSGLQGPAFVGPDSTLGAIVPEGSGFLEFSYLPDSFLVGCVISFMTIGTLSATVWFRSRGGSVFFRNYVEW